MISKRDQKKARQILRKFNIKFRLSSRCETAWAYPYVAEVVIGTKLTDRRRFFSNLFHEIAHVECYRNKKFFNYHNDRTNIINKISTDKLKYLIRVWLRAERYTDKVGKRLMQKHMPEMRFHSAYSEPHVPKYLEEYEFKKIREVLKRRIDKMQ